MIKTGFRIGWLLAFYLFIPVLAFAQIQPVVHEVSFPDHTSQYIEVDLRLNSVSDRVELAMPNWIPGSYLIRDFASQVEGFTASDEGGNPLPVTKIAKNRWLIESSDIESLNVNYSVWAGELGVRTNYVNQEFALINGAGLFLFSEETRARPQRVQFSPPDAWEKIFTSLTMEEDSYLAENFDELVDSPVLLGNAPSYTFRLDGQDYVLVNQGESRVWDGSLAAQDVAMVVSEAQKFWGQNPLDRTYYFLNIIAQGGGGIEHDHSTVLMTDRWRMRKREEYIRWLSLVSHEFFHVWNVRRLRPRELVHYDYEQETPVRELWIAEGITSYYDNLLLVRAGLITVDEFLVEVAREFHQYETTPGKDVQSAEQASFDAWIKAYKPNANSINSAVSYYRKGALTGFVTDMLIRRKTEHESSLDDLMRELYDRYGPDGSRGVGYPSGAFEDLLEEMTDRETRRQVENWLETTADPDIDLALDWYGLDLDRDPTLEAALEAEQPPPMNFGLIWTEDPINLVAASVIRGGAAEAAGVLPGDEILALNGERLNKGNIDDILSRLRIEDRLELLLARHGMVQLPLQISPQPAVSDEYQITLGEDIDEQQKRHLEKWLASELEFETD